MRVLVVAPARYPIRQPHAGGLEAAVWDRVRSLRAQGHDARLVAPRGSDFLDRTPAHHQFPEVDWNGRVSSDERYPRGHLDAVSQVFDTVIDDIISRPFAFDLIDNHSLHPALVARSSALPIPVITTLHTPPLPEIVAASRVAGENHAFVAVSGHTQREWAPFGVTAAVHPNVIDPDAWPLGPGGTDLVWFGRLAPEKGVHFAIDAARIIGRRLTLAGRIADQRYYDRFVRPRLGCDIRHVGLLRRAKLARLIGRAGCALVTPRWDEPFGLVIAEALTIGTPVAAFDRGGVGEVVSGLPGTRLVTPDNAQSLAAAASDLLESCTQSRSVIREAALRRFSAVVRQPRLDALFRRTLASGTGGSDHVVQPAT